MVARVNLSKSNQHWSPRISVEDCDEKMATCYLLVALGLVALHHRTGVTSAAIPFQLNSMMMPSDSLPMSSNVYYLQDYCSVCKLWAPKDMFQDNEDDNGRKLVRVTRSGQELENSGIESIEIDYDQDSDHDSDRDDKGNRWKQMFKEKKRRIIERYLNQTKKKIEDKISTSVKYLWNPEENVEKPDDGQKMTIKLERKIKTFRPDGSTVEHKDKRDLKKRDLKQVYLDPIIQPSIVIRSKRPDNVSNNENEVRYNDTLRVEKCRLLVRLANHTLAAILNRTENGNLELGFLVNVRRLGKRADENNDEDNDAVRRVEIVSSDHDSTQYWSQGEQLSNDTLDEVDLLPSNSSLESLTDHFNIDNLEELVNDKWILFELKQWLYDKANTEEKEQKRSKREVEDDEFVINLYIKPTHGDSPAEVENHVPLRRTKRSCPMGTFDCNLNGSLCIPNSLRCNGENNCGNNYDELVNCGHTVNLYYVYGSGDHHSGVPFLANYLAIDTESYGFWFATRVLFTLFAICLFLYILSVLCRLCDRFCAPQVTPLVLPKMRYTPIPGGSKRRRSLRHFGAQMDTSGSKITEYIYVNNNYGQPQGATTVSTDVAPSRDNKTSTTLHENSSGSAISPDTTDDEYPPLYDEVRKYANYGTKQ